MWVIILYEIIYSLIPVCHGSVQNDIEYNTVMTYGRIKITAWNHQDTPYLALTSEQFVAYCEYFEEYQPCYNSTTLHYKTWKKRQHNNEQWNWQM